MFFMSAKVDETKRYSLLVILALCDLVFVIVFIKFSNKVSLKYIHGCHGILFWIFTNFFKESKRDQWAHWLFSRTARLFPIFKNQFPQGSPLQKQWNLFSMFFVRLDLVSVFCWLFISNEKLAVRCRDVREILYLLYLLAKNIVATREHSFLYLPCVRILKRISAIVPLGSSIHLNINFDCPLTRIIVKKISSIFRKRNNELSKNKQTLLLVFG